MRTSPSPASPVQLFRALRGPLLALAALSAASSLVGCAGDDTNPPAPDAGVVADASKPGDGSVATDSATPADAAPAADSASAADSATVADSAAE